MSSESIEARLAHLEALVGQALARSNGGGGSGGVTLVTATDPMQITGSAGLHPNVRIKPGTAQSQVPVWDVGAGAYVIRQLTEDDIAAGFSISGFSGGSTVEVGATVTNPAFTASYSSVPDSANITNTDGTDSPKALTTPFASGTVTGAFHKTTSATVTFTLHATKGAVTDTAATNINFFPRTFGGVGAAGAASATASGTTAILNGGAGTLPSEGLFASIVGQTFPTITPSAQKIYILTPHTATPHTFKDQNNFAFAMNAPTTFSFTNVQGVALSYDLYESTNILSAPFTITVVT